MILWCEANEAEAIDRSVGTTTMMPSSSGASGASGPSRLASFSPSGPPFFALPLLLLLLLPLSLPGLSCVLRW